MCARHVPPSELSMIESFQSREYAIRKNKNNKQTINVFFW